MNRREDWPEALSQYVDSIRMKPFVWGSHDCFLMPADAILAMTGVDIAAQFRGTYDDAASAYEAILRYSVGYGPGLEKLAAQFGMKPWASPNLAQRGDLCWMKAGMAGGENRFGGIIGIVVTPWVFVLGMDGLLATSPDYIERAWHVPA